MFNCSDILRGYTDTIILAQLASGDSYGYLISKNVQEIAGGEMRLKEATLYTTFRRLETAGMVESYWGDETIGARRRYYHLTDAGRKLYEENRDEWRHYSAMISELIDPPKAKDARCEDELDADAANAGSCGSAAQKSEQEAIS